PTMPTKGKKTSNFDPADPPFYRQASFSLPIPSVPDFPFSRVSTPTGTTSPTKRQRSDTSSSYLAGFESWSGDARDYWLHRWNLLTPKEGKPPGPTNYPLSSAPCSATYRRTIPRRWTPSSPFSQ